MGSKIDRTGEKNINNFGSEMIITEYRNAMNIDVYFPEYNWTLKNAKYGNFKKGTIKCPYERRYYGVGYIGEGKYKISDNSKLTRVYETWHNMLKRCYDKKYHEKKPTYIGCEVCEEWLNFQHFGKWYDENYYDVDNEKMCLDKDILVKDNKVYSPETCVFVPEKINALFVKRQNNRGDSVIGTSFKNDKYKVNCSSYDFKINKQVPKYLGKYDTEEKAFKVYKEYKERNIKEVADYYKSKIPEILYNRLYDYEVEITD